MTRTSSPRRARAAATALAAVSVATLVAGCSHGSSAATKASAAKSGTTAVTTVPKADNIVNDPKARPSVHLQTCAASTSGWSAGGTVTNSGAKSSTFTIVVSFTTPHSTVLARGETKVTVKAGATKSWTTAANFAKSKGTQCVLRGVAES